MERDTLLVAIAISTFIIFCIVILILSECDLGLNSSYPQLVIMEIEEYRKEEEEYLKHCHWEVWEVDEDEKKLIATGLTKEESKRLADNNNAYRFYPEGWVDGRMMRRIVSIFHMRNMFR